MRAMSPMSKFILIALLTLLGSQSVVAQFDDSEIRVIRPKYFIKNARFDVGVRTGYIGTQPFIHLWNFTGFVGFHLTGQFNFELEAYYILKQDREDRDILKNPFSITPQLIHQKYGTHFNIGWTPIYGKFLMGSGALIYYDFFFTGGVGASGVDFNYDYCSITRDPSLQIDRNKVVNYISYASGLGQRFFLNQHNSIRFDVKGHFIPIDKNEGSCHYVDSQTFQKPTEDNESIYFDLSVQLGYSYYF